jgi:hypothetical protein
LKLLLRVKTSWSNSPSPSTINNYFSLLLFSPPLTSTMMTTIVIKLQLWKELLHYLMEPMWENMGTNSCSNLKVVIGGMMVIDSTIMKTCMSSFSKSPFGFWLNVKICHPHKHAFLQILLMHVYMKWLDPISDYGQSCPIQQTRMQIWIAWIFHASICNSIKGAILIDHFCFKHNISNYKIQIIHHNN